MHGSLQAWYHTRPDHFNVADAVCDALHESATVMYASTRAEYNGKVRAYYSSEVFGVFCVCACNITFYIQDIYYIYIYIYLYI